MGDQLHISADFSAGDGKLGEPQSRAEQIESSEIGILKGRDPASCDVSCSPFKFKDLGTSTMLVFDWPCSSILKMEVTCSYERSVEYRWTTCVWGTR
jgi:hypothetical protein